MVKALQKFFQRIKQHTPTHVVATRDTNSNLPSKQSSRRPHEDHIVLRVRFTLAATVLLLIIISISFVVYEEIHVKNTSIALLESNKQTLNSRLALATKQYLDLKNQDQYKINQQLKATINDIQTTYTDSISAYQDILDLQTEQQKTAPLTTLYAQTVQYLAKLNYSSASATLKDLQGQIQQEKDAYAAAQSSAGGVDVSNASPSNTPPGSGFSQQVVSTANGNFAVDIIAADLNSTRVVADTASSGDCSNNCPAIPLGDYVSRNGAYAGINGTFFCPIDYPSCAGKTNSFDTLLMNKNKTYFNSANNVYSTVPAIIVSGTSVRFVSQSLQWGRDTSPDMVLAMQPLLVIGGQVAYGGSSDPKFESRGARGFIANKGSTIFIGDVLNATMADSAQVMKSLGMDNALNLDEGGSTALWYGGYKLGPGRNLPNAVLFIRK